MKTLTIEFKKPEAPLFDRASELDKKITNLLNRMEYLLQKSSKKTGTIELFY